MTYGTKYHPLFEHLLFSGQGQVTMTFAEIEAVLEAPLPPSALAREEWWSNSARGHSQASAWMRANYSTSRVELDARKVTFTLNGWPEGYVRSNFLNRAVEAVSAGLGETAQKPLALQGAAETEPHPLFGVWRGKVRLIPGYDYTKPAYEPDDSLGD